MGVGVGVGLYYSWRKVIISCLLLLLSSLFFLLLMIIIHFVTYDNLAEEKNQESACMKMVV